MERLCARQTCRNGPVYVIIGCASVSELAERTQLLTEILESKCRMRRPVRARVLHHRLRILRHDQWRSNSYQDSPAGRCQATRTADVHSHASPNPDICEHGTTCGHSHNRIPYSHANGRAHRRAKPRCSALAHART